MRYTSIPFCILSSVIGFYLSTNNAQSVESKDKLYAAEVVFDSNETPRFAKSLGAAEVNAIGAGMTEVLFRKDVSKCFYQATLKEVGEITLNPRSSNKKGIFVLTLQSGLQTYIPYYLTVYCPKS